MLIKVAQHRPEYLTVLAFRQRFTQPERVAIETAAATSMDVRVYLADLAASTYVSLQDPRIIAGLEALVAVELLTEQRKDEILQAPVAPHEIFVLK